MTNKTLEKSFKIPFIWTDAEIVSTLLDVNLLAKSVGKGNNIAGLDVNLYKFVEGDNKVGFDFNFYKEVRENNKTGLDFNFGKIVKGDNKTGLDINVCKNVKGQESGINGSIIYSDIGSVNKGSLSYATFYNGINKVEDYGIAFQFSGIYNNAKEVSDNCAVLQFGLVNKIGDSYSLFVNAKGLGNLPRIIKNALKKKTKDLEGKIK